jgi:hypothetical protein
MSGEEELIKKAKMSMEIIDEAFSSEDEDNMAQPKEIDDDEEVVVARKSEVQLVKEVVREEDLANEEGPITKIVPIEDRDWPKRMQEYNYNPRQRAFVERCLQKKQDFIDFKNHFEWRELISDPKNDVHMWHRSSERGLACLKSQGSLDFTPRQIWLTLMGGQQYKS